MEEDYPSPEPTPESRASLLFSSLLFSTHTHTHTHTHTQKNTQVHLTRQGSFSLTSVLAEHIVFFHDLRMMLDFTKCCMWPVNREATCFMAYHLLFSLPCCHV